MSVLLPTRRECLRLMFGATAAAALAPLVDLTDLTPRFWEQAPIVAARLWRIRIDNVVFSFTATVEREHYNADDQTFSLDIRTTGPMQIEYVALGMRPAEIDDLEGNRTMQLKDVELPSLENITSGMTRLGPLTIKGNWL